MPDPTCDYSSPFAAWKYWIKLAPEYCYSGSPAKPSWATNVILPTGQLGYRSLHQLVPIEGRRRTAGTIDFDFMPDIGGLLLWWAMGSVSSTPTADASNPLRVAAVWADGTQFAVTNPTVPAALSITLAGTTVANANATIVIVGTDINGEAITETLTIQQSAGAVDVDGDYYTRYVYATVTGITITGVTVAGAATCAVNGYNYTTHTFSMYDTQPTFKMEEFGLPSSTSGSSHFHRGLICSSFSLAFDAAAMEGIMAESLEAEGMYPITGSPTCARPRLPVLAPMAAWTCAISRGGSAYRKALGGEISLDTGASSHEVATGTQDPFGAVWGPRDLTLTLRVNAEDASEFGWLENQTVSNISIVFTSPYRISGDTYYSLTLAMTRAYITSHTDSESDDLIQTELVFNPIVDEEDNVAGLDREIMTATLVNQVISYAGYA